MVSLSVFSQCNEIQNFHLGLWGKAPFSNALTKERVLLNSRKECLLHAHAFLAPISIPVEKFPEAYDSWAFRLEFRWSEKENYTLRFWGPSSSTQRPETGPDTCCVYPTSWGSSSSRGFEFGGGNGGAEMGEMRTGWRRLICWVFPMLQ